MTRAASRLARRGPHWAFALTLLACKPDPATPRDAHDRAATGPTQAPAIECPAPTIRVTRSPGTEPRHEDLSFWLGKLEALAPGEPERVFLAPGGIQALNDAAASIDGAWRSIDAPDLSLPERVQAQLSERVLWMAGQVDGGSYSEAVPGSFARARARIASAQPVDELRAVVRETDLRCMPLTLDEPLYKVDAAAPDAAPDRDFDRNNCASLHAGEWVRVLKHLPASDGGEGSWDYVHAGHSVGWVHNAKLTPATPLADFAAWQRRPRVVPVDDDVQTSGGHRLRLGGVAYVAESAGADPSGGPLYIMVATATGWEADAVQRERVLFSTPSPTRRQLLTWAFGELNAPYGWGGRAGERDCSRYLRDLFAGFGIELARHSAVQAKHGPLRVDVSSLAETEKLKAIADAHLRGPVLLYMRGHIMLYLGQDPAEAGDGAAATEHFAISSISEFLEPCDPARPEAPPNVRRLDRVAVTTLDLGRGTPRRSFAERIEALVVFTDDLPAESAAG